MRLDNAAFDKGLDDSGRKFGKLQSVIESGVKAGAKLFAGATTAVVGLGVAALKVGLDYNRMQQSSRAALTTLLGSAEAANAQMDKLDEFARTSPFSKQVFIEAQRQMIGFGIEAKNVIPALDSIQNAVAAMGGSNADISAIVDSLSKMQSQGRLSGITLKELGQYGIDAAAIIGEKMGKSGAEIREMASKPGGIPVEQIWDPLVDGLMDRFGGAADNIKEQFDGAADRVKAAWRDIGSVLAEPFIDPKGGGLAVEWTNKLADAMRAAEAKIRPLTTLLLDRFAPGIAAVTPLLERAEGAINAWDLSKVNAQLDGLTKYTPLIAGTSAALFALGTTNLPILSQLGFTGINPVVAGLAALVATSPAARDALSGVFSAASPLAETAKQLGIVLSDTLMYAINELVPAAGALAVAFVEAGVPLVQSLTPALVSLMTAAVPLVDVVASIAQWVAELPTPILAAGLAFVALMGPLKPVTDGLANVAQGFVRIVQQAQVQAVLGNTNVAMGGLARASATAGPAIRGVGTALKGAFVASGIGLAIAGIVAALGAFAAKSAEAKARTEEYRSALSGMGDDAMVAAQKVMAANLVAEDSFGWTERLKLKSLLGEEIGSVADALDVLGFSLGEVTDAAMASDAVWESYKQQMLDSVEANSAQWQAITLIIQKVEEQRGALEGARHAEEQMANAQRDGADATRDHTDALREQQDALLEAANAAIGQSKALRRQEEAQERTRKALSDLNKTTKDAEASEKDIERARRDVEAALDDEAASHWDLIGAMERNNATTEDLRAKTRSARDAFVESAIQMGKTRAEAEALADSYGLIPAKINTQVSLETAAAKWQLDEFVRTASGRVIKVRTELGSGVTTYDYGGGVRARADGGIDVPSYANGKMPHQAIIQAAKPGLVQWAEPETHGEAFIPLAPSKRARSLAIWEETGRRLGAFTRSFADGGTTGRAPAPAPGLGSVVNVVLSDSQFARFEVAAERGIRAGMGDLASRALLSGVVV